MRPLSGFFEDAKVGNLPSVTWLDPSFLDVEETLGQMNLANDDHPPGDVARGQHLVWQIYDALSHSPSWSKTLLIITYDEHGGGFYEPIPPGTGKVPWLLAISHSPRHGARPGPRRRRLSRRSWRPRHQSR